MTEEPEGQGEALAGRAEGRAAGSPGAIPSSDARAVEERRWSAWMALAQAGDAAAYQQLLEELQVVLGSYLRRLLGDPGLVEDGVQETLLAVHRARHTYDPRRPFRPWLVAIARHKAIDQLRRGRNPGRAEASLPVDLTAEAPSENRPEAALEVARLLDGLPVAFREAIVLTKLQGRTVDEAAQAAGVSATAMRTRVHRGMHQLRRRLEGEPL